jgi:hypothetical protein
MATLSGADTAATPRGPSYFVEHTEVPKEVLVPQG